jgi:hypothetical protein
MQPPGEMRYLRSDGRGGRPVPDGRAQIGQAALTLEQIESGSQDDAARRPPVAIGRQRMSQSEASEMLGLLADDQDHDVARGQKPVDACDPHVAVPTSTGATGSHPIQDRDLGDCHASAAIATVA